jgi:hypothetical protein
MHLYPRLATDYALGWAKDARPAPGPSEAYPPDAPPTVTHGVYPEFYIPPFHFRNPVTGALPQYPEGLLPTAIPIDSTSTSPELARAGGDVSVATLTRVLETAEQRLERAIAYDAVENLANAYNFYLDEFDHGSAMELFEPNGSDSVVNLDVAGGRESILDAIEGPRDHAVDGRPSGVMTIHQKLQPVIKVADDGTSATIRLRLFASSGRLGEEGAWIAGVYTGEASAQNGGWQLDRLDLHLTWAADYASGWASAAPFARLASVPDD